MITNDGIIQPDNKSEAFYNEIIGWAHQCWQVHVLGKQIDLTEFKRRMNVDTIDYKQFIVDNSAKLDLQPTYDKLYMLRVLHVLYPEEYNDPDKE